MSHCFQRHNVQGKRAAAKTAGRQKTGDPPLRLTDLLGDGEVSDANILIPEFRVGVNKVLHYSDALRIVNDLHGNPS